MKKKVCIVNVCAGYGGVERLIEDWVSLCNPEHFEFSYAYTPYPGHEEHAQAVQPHLTEFHTLDDWVPVFFPNNVETGNAAEASSAASAPPANASLLKKLYSVAVPQNLQGYIWYHRQIPRLAKTLENIFTKIQPDVIHFNTAVNSWLSTGLVAAVNACPTVPRIVHIHNPPVFHHPTFYDRRCLKRVDRFVFVSDATRKEWSGLTPGNAETQVIHNAVDTDYYSPAQGDTSQANPSQTALHFGCCTRLSPMKGLDTLLEACAILKSQTKNFRVTIAGTGPEEEVLHQQSKQLGLGKHVHFAGHTDEVLPLLRSMDVYLQASRATEGLPMALLEAMATGLPCIATEVGGTCEAVITNVTGRVVPIEDPTALASAMRGLIEHPEQVGVMGKAAREHAVDHFAKTRMIPEIEKLYLS